MGKLIVNVVCTYLLGVSVTSNNGEGDVNIIVHTNFVVELIVFYDFQCVPCDVKSILFHSYCSDMYGSKLWNYSKLDVDIFCCTAEVN